MDREPIKSKAIRSVGYDPETKTLEIEFQSGGVYQYPEVSPEHYSDLLEADSAGKYFHQVIRPRYTGRQIS